ncbi:ankyrin repeat domain-containing protein 24-like [Acanthaster planci]|uniref:Ankyrin repeat domain-containing protein 24-like n=1 Tax=Acanthaster planci TaxID=133434 RepID=A0A8B8A0X3_ACAPL|nr:ankyrin repeat domain-containing protein 24-like [Acanthaster planci]
MSETASSVATNSVAESKLGVASKTVTTAAHQLSKPGSREPTSRPTFDNDEFMAAAIGDTAWLKQSLRSGRDPSQYDRNGLAAIHLAALHGRLECLKLLVEKYKVDVNLPSSTGWRPVHLAINSRTGKRSLSCVQYLLDQGADASLVNEDDLTPAHQAAIEGSVKCLEALINSNAAIHLQDNKGHLPLDYAKIWGHRKCARILASESWRQGKNYQAGEMEKLKHLRTLKEDDDRDAEESQLAHKEFYGSLSFTNWLDEKGLQPKPIGPPLKRVSRPDIILKMGDSRTTKNMMYKANSMTQGKQRSPPRDQPRTSKPQQKGRVSDVLAKHKPNKKNVAQQRDGKHSPHVAFVNVPDGKTRPCMETAVIPDLPQDVVERVIEQKPSPHDRPLEFKCKNIIDAQHRRLFTGDVKTESEMYAHISDSLDSRLFPGNSRLLLETHASSRSGHSEESSGSGNIDVERVAKMMKELSKPPRFPPIEGHSYKYSFEVM